MAEQDISDRKQEIKELDDRFEELKDKATYRPEKLQQMFEHRAEVYHKRRRELEWHLDKLEKTTDDTVKSLERRVDRLWEDVKGDLEGLETLFRENE